MIAVATLRIAVAIFKGKKKSPYVGRGLQLLLKENNIKGSVG